MRLLATIWDLFARRLRLSNPWNYKAPVLIAVTYIMMLRGGFGWVAALVGFAWSICTIVGIAGFGYLSNDLGDRAADRAAGKPNLLLELSMGQILALMGLFLGLAILPWGCYFPVDARSVACLLGEFLLFVLYVLPPMRLKERGLLGLVTDALYAHALPTYLAAITFEALAPRQGGALWPLLASLVAWQFCLGLRNILLHQLKDADNDRHSGLRTYVTQAGEGRATHLLAHVLVPLELLTWLLLLGALTALTWLPLLGWPIYLAVQFPKGHRQLDLRAWLYRYMDDFYIGWLPLAILAAACWQDWRLIGLAGLHLLLFKSAFSQARNRLFHLIYRPS